MKKNKKYFLNFIEEAIFNPKYLRFFTKKLNEWKKFRDKWDFKKVDDAQIEKIKDIVKEKYYDAVRF